jgi:hypothetical protein
VLHDCSDATVDICFVHGLTGDRESTWSTAPEQPPWPKTLLPPRLEKACILTYGYDAYLVRISAPSSNRLIDHARNLLNDLTVDRAASILLVGSVMSDPCNRCAVGNIQCIRDEKHERCAECTRHDAGSSTPTSESSEGSSDEAEETSEI